MNSTREKVYVDRRPPAAKDNTATLTLVAAATALVLGAMALVFWLMAGGAPVPEAAPVDSPPPTPVASPLPTPSPTATATAAAPTVPPAPPSNELVGNEWLLSPYAVRQDNGRLIVTGTLQNLASETRSAHVSVFVYVSGTHIATATGTVNDVAAGDSIPVSLPSDMQWQPGDKVLLVVAEDEAPADSGQAQALP